MHLFAIVIVTSAVLVLGKSHHRFFSKYWPKVNQLGGRVEVCVFETLFKYQAAPQTVARILSTYGKIHPNLNTTFIHFIVTIKLLNNQS